MHIVHQQPDPNTHCLRLAGRLDLAGTGEIDLRFTSLASTNDDDVLVDMGGVEFVASIGMRLLLSNAKAKAARGGRMVLFGVRPLVREALETAGIDTLIPIYADEPAALAGLGR
jgi:anti-anti-sigma factor